MLRRLNQVDHLSGDLVRAPALDSQEIPSVARLADSFVRFLSANLGCIVSSTVRPFKGKLQRRIPA